MATKFEDLRILHVAEEIADGIWMQVTEWNEFARDVVGKQMARSADSIGANIAESYGRYHFGEKLQFLYYARGSLFETKYWLNRASTRQLMPTQTVQTYAGKLSKLAHQLNLFAGSIKRQRAGKQQPSSQLRETPATYTAVPHSSLDIIHNEDTFPLFTKEELTYIESEPNNEQSPNLIIS
jgi:four helix bundle protein